MVTLTFDEAVTLLKRAINEKGSDYVYNNPDETSVGCLYFHGDQPGCIVGHVLSYKGISPADLAGQNNATVGVIIDDSLVAVDSEKTYALLAKAQQVQDRGNPWGEALEAALHHAENDVED